MPSMNCWTAGAAYPGTDPMKILVVKTSAIGDVTHTLPSLNAIRKRFPNAHITWLVEKASAEVVEGHEAIDRVLVCDRKQWIKNLSSPLLYKRTVIDILKFVKTLRDTDYDFVIDFQGLLKSAVWVFLSRGNQKLGFGPGMAHAESSYIFYNRKVPAVSMEYHAIKRELMLLDSIGVSCDRVEFHFPLEPCHQEKINGLLRLYKITDTDPLVAVNPMARWNTKLWDPQKFAEVADWIREGGFRVCFTGGKEDYDDIEKIRCRMKHDSVNLAGRTSLKTLAALYKKARLVLTTDTGPMHIAAAIRTPVVALFGPTAPWRTGPFGPGHQVVQVKMDCVPCFKRTCDTRACMEQITAEMVISRLQKILSAR